MDFKNSYGVSEPAMMSRRCMRGPMVFFLLAIRFPRTTPAKSRSGSTAIAPSVQPVWQMADEENPVRVQTENVDFSAVMSQPKLRLCPPWSNDGANIRS